MSGSNTPSAESIFRVNDSVSNSSTNLGDDELAAEQVRHARKLRRQSLGAAGLLVLAALSLLGATGLVYPREALLVVTAGGDRIGFLLSALVACLLAGGVRRGTRGAALTVLAFTSWSAAVGLLQEGDSSALLVILVAWIPMRELLGFRGRSTPTFRRTIVGVATAGGVLTVVGSLLVRLLHPTLPVSQAAASLVGYLTGWGDDLLLVPEGKLLFALVATSATLGMVLVAWAAGRPADPDREEGYVDSWRARATVQRWGTDTLAWFSLRDDKRWFFHGDCGLAYRLLGSVALVSPDPIGPPEERPAAWTAFSKLAEERGWTVAVLGAGPGSLADYRRSGMRHLYLGDEAIVDCGSFRLQGGDRKGLRQAVNRIARYGYRVSFHDPTSIDPYLKRELAELAAAGRRGDRERGFSMTLGRLCDPSDRDLLLAVCCDSDGRAVAFCQFVPAPELNGWSLDLMRRDDGDHPNGVLDFVIVETIRHLSLNGGGRLCLNFAVLREVLAEESPARLRQKVLKRLLKIGSRQLQIESLWRFNQKYDPIWRPRYLVYESALDLPATAWAIAVAEGATELPLVGRWVRSAMASPDIGGQWSWANAAESGKP